MRLCYDNFLVQGLMCKFSKTFISAFIAFLAMVSFAKACPRSCEDSVSDAPSRSTETNIYSETLVGKFNPVTNDALYRVYVPNHSSNTVTVIDPVAHKVVDKFVVGRGPQHIVPSWDMKTLWVANTANQTQQGSVTPIDPKSGKPGKQISINDPYNIYFTPDGSSAVVVAEAYHRLELRDPQTFELQSVIPVPICRGMNHGDFAADFSFIILTCEFNGMPHGLTGRKNQTIGAGDGLIKVDLKAQKLLSALVLSKPGMPQDIRLSADGKTFYVTDMFNGGVFTIDATTFSETGFIPTGIGAHGLNVSRDSKFLYVSNRGSKFMPDKPRGNGGVSVIEFATNKVVANWTIPGGGSPDMGNVTPDGKELWVTGRFDGQVYAFDTTTGAVIKINVGIEPHGLTVWPQPGRFTLGHTGNMR
jgi:YVTN family beta-propeller protein